MRLIRHLVAHDVRTHHRLLLAWVAIVIAQPIVAVLPWPALEAAGVAMPLFLVASRLVLGAAAIATIVQADSPLDDRTFWRTRPVAARTMAIAKLVIGALFVGVPLVVVLVVALFVQVPLSHWPSTVAQVVITDAAAVGLAMLLAARTRTIATMLIALLGTLVAGYVLLIAMTETLAVPWVRQFYALGPPDSRFAAPTMLAVAVLASWTMTALVFLGERYRLRLLLLGATSVIALAVIWFVPAARAHEPAPKFARLASLSVDAASVHAERLESGRIALIAEGSLTGVQPGDRTRQYLYEGTLDTPLGSLAAREAGDTRFLEGRRGTQPVLLGVLSEGHFAQLAGRTIGFEGQLTLEVARTDLVGTLPVAAGAVLDAGDLRVHIRDVQPSVPTRANFRAVATADIAWTTTWTQAWRLPVTQWRLREGSQLRFINRFTNARLTWLLLVPSLAQPFGWQRAVLAVPAGLGSGIDSASASIEIEQSQGQAQAPRPVRLSFVVPSTAAPFQASAPPR